jgi:WD40 repeat protein
VRYRAFLSYSRKDNEAAGRLHRALDGYRTPKSLVATSGVLGPVPRKLHPVFRDRTDMAGGGALTAHIEGALADSEALVVLCSPASADSPWVNEEVQAFQRLGRTDRIFPVIAPRLPDVTDVESEFFPKALRGIGLLAADLREIRMDGGRIIGDGFSGGRFKLIAGLLGVPLDTLLQRERRRQRRLTAALAFAAVAFAVVAGAAVYLGAAAARSAEQARVERDRARLRLADNLVVQAGSWLGQQDFVKARMAAREATLTYRELGASAVPAQMVLSALNAVSPEPVFRLMGHDAPITALQTTFSDRLISADAKGRLCIWNPDTGERTQTVEIGARVLGLSIDSNEDAVHVLTEDGAITKVDLRQGSKTPVFTWPAGQTLPGQTPTSRVSLATPWVDGSFYVTLQIPGAGARTESWIARIEQGTSAPSMIVTVPRPVTSLLGIDTSRLLAGTMDSALVIDTEVPRIVTTLAPRSHPMAFASWVTSLAYSPVDQTAGLASSDGIIDWFSLKTGTELATTRTFRNGVASLETISLLSPAAVAFRDGAIGFSSPDAPSPFLRYWDSPSAPTSIVGKTGLPPEPWQFATGSEDGVVRLWPRFRGREGESDSGDGFTRFNLETLIAMVDVHPDGSSLLATDPVNLGEELIVGPLPDLQNVRRLTLPGEVALGGAVWAKDGRHAWVALDNGKIVSIDTTSGAVGPELCCPAAPLHALATSGDRTLMAGVTEKGVVHLWKDGLVFKTWQSAVAADGPGSVSVSASGNVVLVAAGNQIEVCRTVGAVEITRLTLPAQQAIGSVAISRAGDYAVVGTDGGQLSVWSLATGVREWERPASGSSISGVAFLPEGTAIAAGSQDGDISIWGRLDGVELYRKRYLPPVHGLSVFPDGTIAASVMGDSQIYGKVDLILWRPPHGR